MRWQRVVHAIDVVKTAGIKSFALNIQRASKPGDKSPAKSSLPGAP